MEELGKKIKQLSYLSDRYDPRYTGKERNSVEIPDTDCEERMSYMRRNRTIVIGGSHTRPLQAFVLRLCEARYNNSGRSVSVEVSKMLARFPTGGEYYNGTNMHNTVEFADVYEACMAEQPWERKRG